MRLNRSKNHHLEIISYQNVKKVTCLKSTYGLLGKDYRVAKLSKLYLTVSGIISPSLKSIGQFHCAYHVRTDVPIQNVE